jgi:hypothetical protein
MNDFKHPMRVVLAAAAAVLLTSCGGGGAGGSATSAPVAWDLAIASTPLNAQQQAALDNGATLLSAGNYDGAIAALTTLRSGVQGINTEVEADLGLSYAARSGLSMSAYRAAAVARTYTFPTETFVMSPGDAALYQLTNSPPGFSADLAILDGNAALQMLVPPNTPVNSLPEARQAEIGMIATVQFLRVIANVMGGNSKNVSDATISSRVQAGYDADARASLNRAAKLLTATNAALSNSGVDGLAVSLPSGLTAQLADGDITPAELVALLKQYKR